MWPYVWMALLGLVAAFVAKLILPGKNPPNNIIGTALIGIAGAYVGTFLGQLFGLYQSGEYAGFIGSVVGSILLLFIYGLLFKPKAPPVASKPAAPPPPPQPPVPPHP